MDQAHHGKRDRQALARLPVANGSSRAGLRVSKKYAAEDFKAYEELLAKRHGPEKARMIETGSGNYLIFPNLIVIDGWHVFRTFYPTSPD